MDLFKQMEKEYYSRKEHQLNMDLFRQAEKEYLDQLSIKAVNQQSNIEACEQQLCFEGCKHQFINLSGVMTCDSCGLETYPVSVSEYNCWDTVISRVQANVASVIGMRIFGIFSPDGNGKGISTQNFYDSQNPTVSLILVAELAHVHKGHLDLLRQSFVMVPGWFVNDVRVLRLQPFFDVFPADTRYTFFLCLLV